MTSLDHVAGAGTDISQQKWRPEEAGALAVEGKLCPGAGFDVLNSFFRPGQCCGSESSDPDRYPGPAHPDPPLLTKSV